MRYHCAVMRVFLPALEKMAGLHQLVTGLMDGRFRVVDGAENGVTVRHVGHEGEAFADLDAGDVRFDLAERAADVGGGIGFEIERVELAGAADEEEKDAVDIV